MLLKQCEILKNNSFINGFVPFILPFKNMEYVVDWNGVLTQSCKVVDQQFLF
jgi:hypothetical protein